MGEDTTSNNPLLPFHRKEAEVETNLGLKRSPSAPFRTNASIVTLLCISFTSIVLNIFLLIRIGSFAPLPNAPLHASSNQFSALMGVSQYSKLGRSPSMTT
jgi:hypothetical protein